MGEEKKQQNDFDKIDESRPPYRWDEELKEITGKVKEIIEKEEKNNEENQK